MSPRARVRSVVFALAAALAAASSQGAPPKKKPKVDVAALGKALKTSDEDKLAAALADVAKAGKDAAALAPDVEALLQKGAPQPIVLAAFKALAALGQPSSSKRVATWTHHRNVELRKTALVVLGATGGKDAVPPLRRALSDKERSVRGAAATSLGTLGAHEALPDLESALDRKVFEAAAAIGKVCDADECNTLSARLGKAPFDVVASGIEQVLFRAAVSDDLKVKLVEKVRDVGTGEAHRFLADLAGRFSGSARVKTALADAAQATKASPDDKPKDKDKDKEKDE